MFLAGCAGSATPLPATTKLLDDLPRVANSASAPCRMQKEVAAQNSYLATIKGGQEVVYKAPCDVDKKPAPPKPNVKPVAEVKTS